MAVVLTIAGTTKTFLAGSLQITETVNGRWTMDFDIVSTAGTYRPAIDAEVILTVGGVTVFGGYITGTTEAGAGGLGRVPIVTSCQCSDYASLAERRLVSFSPVTQTVKAFLQYIHFTYLSEFGVNINDAAWPTGPTLTNYGVHNRRSAEVLSEVAGLYSPPRVWRIDETKTLQCLTPGSASAPFAIASGDGHVIGDLTVSPNREFYANTVVCDYGQGTYWIAGEGTTGNGVASAFVVAHTVNSLLRWVYFDGDAQEVFAAWYSGVRWTFDPATNTLTYHNASTGAALAVPNGVVLTWDYLAQFPDTVTVPSTPVAAGTAWETPIELPDIFDTTTATLIANAYLANAVVIPKQVEFVTNTAGLHAGQSLSINLAARNINNTFLITDVNVTDHDNILAYTVRADEGLTVAGSWRDTYKAWGGGGSGGTTFAGTFIPPAAGSGAGRVVYPLGGSTFAAVETTSGGVYVPAWDAVTIQLNSGTFSAATGTVIVTLRTTNAGTNVTPRLRDITNNVTAGTGAAVTGVTWTTVTFTIALSAGVAFYRLELLGNTLADPVYGVGYLELVG